ncbi:hypothetical protein HI914_03912 [Erysiphe necator]|nr:hypothetical protein HI914_03912 [Erysiphe necator]
MIKRSSKEAKLTEQVNSKRLKVSDSASPLSTDVLKITSGKQLQQLLTFSQDKRNSFNDIQTFKSFLDTIIAGYDSQAKLLILKEYFELQKSYSGDQNSGIFLCDLIKIWSFASESNKENLLSAVPSVLALLLKITSNSLELLTYGISLGKVLLHKDQFELIKRGLSANKNKEHVISPILRLLRELSMLDGGALANSVYKARNATFQAMVRNLTLGYTGHGNEELRKPSVRTNAIRFLLQLVKHLSTESKADILSQRDIFSTLIRDIINDPPFLVRDVLLTIEIHIIKDASLPRDAKTKLLSSRFLVNIASLYRYNKSEEKNEISTSSVSESAHKFLLLACSSLDSGVLLKQSGLYPRGLVINICDENNTNLNNKQFDLGLDSIEWIDKYTEKVPVRNSILSEFIYSLKPWSSIRHAELIISIFKAAPELIAGYFSGKNNFLFDPKLTAMWVGYSNLIYSTISLSIPNYFGYEDGYANLPPPLPIMMEHILPRKFSQKLIIKCLGQTTNSLIMFLTARIICISFQKLEAALRMYKQASRGPSASIWNQYASMVIENYSKRIPAISHIIGAYRRLTSTNLCQREVFTKLISLYYEILPHIALETNSGVSSIIAEGLLTIDKTNLRSRDGILCALELENILRLARLSPGMKWFSNSNGLSMSPFLATLRFYALAPREYLLPRLRSVLISIFHESQILQTCNSNAEFDYLIMNIRSILNDNENSGFFKYLDSCISRCAATPTKYIFMLEDLISETGNNICEPDISLLLLAMLEQWPFHVRLADLSTIKITSRFIARYLASSRKLKKDKSMIKCLSKKFSVACADKSEAQCILKSYKKATIDITIPENEFRNSTKISTSIKHTPQVIEKQPRALFEKIGLDDISETNNALTRWRKKDIEDVIEDGYLKSLIMLLSSKHCNIRREALINITKFSHQLKESKFEEREQIWLLLQELLESSRIIINQKPLTSIFSCFASYAVDVLKDPSHSLYPKVNQFLSQKPVWRLDQIPMMHRLIDESPSLDVAVYSEREWLINILSDGLCSEADLEIYRKRLVFERILSCYNYNFGLKLQNQILNILAKACLIKGGISTLVTRFSLVTWLEVQDSLSSNIAVKELYQSILQSCGHKRVKAWSRGTIKSK